MMPCNIFVNPHESPRILTLTRRCSVATYEFSLCMMAATMCRRFSCCSDRPAGAGGSCSVPTGVCWPPMRAGNANWWASLKPAVATAAASAAAASNSVEDAVADVATLARGRVGVVVVSIASMLTASNRCWSCDGWRVGSSSVWPCGEWRRTDISDFRTCIAEQQ